MKDVNPGLSSDDRQRILKAVQDCIDAIDNKTKSPDAAETHIRNQLLKIRAEVERK
jgi:hypothetical protein